MADLSLDQLKADIVEVGRRLYARGFVASNDGNITIRFAEDRLLTTPKSVSKGFMTPEMMVVVDLDGRKVAGTRDASSELKMHLEVYRQRADVKAVVHAHPALATGFAVAGIPLDRAVLAEVICTLGSIPIAQYATPSTHELPDAVRQYIKAHDGLLLANHGALTVGTDVFAAYYKMETIEHFAKISLTARLLGGERLISQEEVLRLQSLRGLYGIASPAPICLERHGWWRGCHLSGGAIAGLARRSTGARSGQRRGLHRPRSRAAGRRRNSVNIPRAGGTHRGRRAEAPITGGTHG
jgi:L-fuculose-phosphate aldolase